MFSALTPIEASRRREGYVQELARQLPPIAGRSPQDTAEVVEDRNATLASGRYDAGENFLRPSTAGVAVASEGLSIDHRRADRLVSPAARGFQSRGFQEGKDLSPVGPQMLGEHAIEGMARERLQELLESGFQASRGHREAVRRQGPGVSPVSESQALPEQIQHRLREACGGSGGGFQKQFGSADHVPQALLVKGVLEKVIGRQAVVGDPAGPARPQNLDQDVVPAALS